LAIAVNMAALTAAAAVHSIWLARPSRWPQRFGASRHADARALTDATEQAELLTLVVVVVLGSVVIHGVGAPVAAHAYARSQTNRLTA
jgi:hypothetical protein